MLVPVRLASRRMFGAWWITTPRSEHETMDKLIKVGAALPEAHESPLSGPDWTQANPRWINGALAITQERPGGGWYVLDASRAIGREPRCFSVAPGGGEPIGLVVFRGTGGEVIAGPNHCPHMGARLSDGRVDGDRVICPWHGLGLGREPRGSWRPVPAHDDGVLVWVQLGAEPATDRPALCRRPDRFIDGVVRMEAACEPRDVIANRLDPWHGAHFHPYSFGALRVLEIADDEITVRVAKRVAGPLAIEVDARFHSPEPRTIAMSIVAGEGAGSVVETHATPLGPGRTAVIEASLAASDRRGFRVALRLSRLIRPLIERSARRLWVDDCAYAERLYEIRAATPATRGLRSLFRR
jgi:isorenieratene synthase